MMIKFSVCIATYKRPLLLKKLIDSLLIQKNVHFSEIEIIVVDNDSEESARTIVDDYYSKGVCKISYYIQPKKNISLTRNLGISEVTGQYIFFIDDDEYADENWMSTHIKNLELYDADGAFGQVKSYFPENTPEWIKNCYVYHRNTNPSGQPTANLNTGNCIIKSDFFLKKKYHFDQEYGITGGSDYHLFSRIQNDGAKFISCFEAVTYEFVPENRANFKWLIKRVFRTGNNYTRTLINRNGKQSFLLSITEFFKGIIQAIIAFLLSIFFLWNKAKSLNWFLKTISNISKPFAVLGLYPEEYKKKTN